MSDNATFVLIVAIVVVGTVVNNYFTGRERPPKQS